MISTVKYHVKIWQITNNFTADWCEIKDNHCVGWSFGHVSVFMFYSGTAPLCAHFLRLNAWIESCVAASLITNRPCWYLHHHGGLTSACSRLRTSNPLTIGYKRAALACRTKQVASEKTQRTELLLIGCNVGREQDARVWRLIRKRGLLGTDAVWEISLSPIGEPCTAMTPATSECWKMKLNIIQSYLCERAAYKEELGCLNWRCCKSQPVESWRNWYNLFNQVFYKISNTEKEKSVIHMKIKDFQVLSSSYYYYSSTQSCSCTFWKQIL